MSMGPPSDLTDDPWDWSVDQVVREFCRSPQDRPSWCSPTDHLPNPTSLERELRENDVTGEVILVAITKEVLRCELNIRSMGQRHVIEKGIHYLRSRSQKFQAIAANAPFTPVHSWLHGSGPPYDHPSNVGGSVLSTVPLHPMSESPRPGMQLDTVGSSNLHNLSASGPVKIPDPCTSVVDAPVVETPVVETAQNKVAVSVSPAMMHKIAAVSPQPQTAVKVRRRIRPTLVAHLEDKARPFSPWFEADDTVARFGKAVDEDLNEREFNLASTDVADPQRISVSRRLKKYLTLSGRRSREDGEGGNGSHAVDINSGDKSTVLQDCGLENNEHGEFGYLLAKYPAKSDAEDVLALYGESGDEGNFDEETWHEIERDRAEDMTKDDTGHTLPLAVVNSTVDAAIEEFRSIWQGTKLAKVQAKGFRLWKKANREGRVEDEIATAQFWVRRFQNSAVKIRQAITRETWTNEGAVRHQCQSLQESIFQQEEHQYYVSVLMRTTPPPRPDRKSIKREYPKPLDLVEGDIVLESESDLSMSNFIDDDMSEPLFTARSPTATEVSPIYAADDHDHVTSWKAKRRRGKPQNTHVDPKSVQMTDCEPQLYARPASSAADSDLEPPPTLPPSRYENAGHVRDVPIELNSSSEPTTPAKFGPSNDTGNRLYNDNTGQNLTPSRLKMKGPKAVPELDDVKGIRQMSWYTIENTQDHRRALAKAIYSLPAGKAGEVWRFVGVFGNGDLRDILHRGFSAIINRQEHVEGIEMDYWEIARLITLLFTSYVLAKSVLDEHRLDKDGTLKKAEGLVELGRIRFLRDIDYILSRHLEKQVLIEQTRRLSHAQSLNEERITSDSESTVPQHTPGKKRRRHVKQSQMAISQQFAGQLRLQEAEQRLASLGPKFQNIPRNMMDPASYAISMEEPIIYLDAKIGSKVKAHQVHGIRFMWRELMTDENKQGCLLAHTMGLGKTMQVISLLVTIAQSAQSPDAGVRRQVPVDLQETKALILCPPSLIDNWYEEILMWRPDANVLGGLYKITQKLRLPDRVQEIVQWSLTGGILIISYDMFRGLIVNKPLLGRTGDVRPLNDLDHAAVQERLFEHPNIIIADEAHRMKNTEAGISMVTSQFKSTRRIALTGSPLANNLDEYFAMIDWIAPGYLGTKEQFRSKYAIPIAEGLWNDSDLSDRRTSLRKLHVLKRNLDPKVSRADITAIANDLPPKTEFFLTIPLTKLQIQAYNCYVTNLLGGNETKATGNARLWDWLAILSLLCNHPSTFLNKLDDRQYGHEKKIKEAKARKVITTDDVEGPGLPTDVELADAGLSPQLLEQQRRIFQVVEDSGRLEDPRLSHRAQIVCDIIELSVAAGDRVLLFSHSIPTLNYLEATVSSLGYSTCRLDGSTNVTKRQEAVKEFNKDTARHHVFFISTRAGGLGLNLQGANRVILFDYGFNPIWEEQAIGRAYRLGQQKPVFVYRLRAGGTFEELIYNKAVFKTQLSARVVDKKNPMRYASKKATDYLFPAKEVPQEDLTPYYGKDPLVLDQVLSKSKCIRDITLTETFQKEEDESLTPEEVKQANDELKDEQEKRRDPARYRYRQAKHQASLLRPSGPNFQVRPLNPGSRQGQQPSTPTVGRHQENRYISRPEAIGGAQQTENGFWDHRATPHLQRRVENVLGLRPFADRLLQSGYQSPTAEARPSGVRRAPGSASQLGRQLDGALADNEDDSEPEFAECRTQ